MRKGLLLILLVITSEILAQEKKEEKNWGIGFHGFVKTDFWFDTRQVGGARENLFALYLLNESLDIQGSDINAKPSFNFSAITSRITGIINGPDALQAKTSGVIEADFSGMSNEDINGFRLRHAYLKLNWLKSEFLFGYYWHPMFVTAVFPEIISLNTGAPFQPFIRNPQIRYTYSSGKLNIIAAVLSQRDYANEGPAGRSPVYISNAIVPNVHLQIQIINKHQIFGLAGDSKILKPELATDSNIITNEKIGTYAIMAYYKFEKEAFTAKFKTILGQNMTEHLLLGGYAVKTYDSISAIKTYTPTNHLFVWGNFLYGKKIKLGIFGGYAKNLGSSDENIGIYYSRGSNIDYLYRFAPSCSVIKRKTQLSFEIEYTTAAYGTPNEKGLVKNTKEISNIRLLFTAFYFF